MSVPSSHEATLFERALAMDSLEAREAFLREACGDDAALRERLLGLLRAHDRAGGFLEHREPPPRPESRAGVSPAPAAPAAEDNAIAPNADAPSALGRQDACPTGDADAGLPRRSDAEAGDHIGRYKLLEKIGEGGMGTVWMAEQDEPVRRRVALKIIKLGMDTREVIARFEAERQALALMDHPNIARVFDGGVTGAESRAGVSPAPAASAAHAAVPVEGAPSAPGRRDACPTTAAGRPYFVMELVRGLPITKYCDEPKLSTRDRLELFGQVCRAVQHAHQKGVIHRDLKPSNILVTEQDGRPVPKVIDFGIAKATEGRLTDKTLFTGFAQLIGTPAYMSPEQAGLGSLDIDTRSDTYSLGVVLYQLLTGHTPFDTQELLKSGIEAVLRTIREVDPPKPSTAVERELKLRVESGDSRGRPTLNSHLKLLSTTLRGDLDWIVMKCLEKDRNRRYDTPNGLEADLERYLHDEPVQARPPSAIYRWRKFTRKHRTGVAAAMGMIALLILGVVASSWQAVRATRSEQAAIAETKGHKQTVSFLRELLEGVRPAIARGRDTTVLREIVDNLAGRVEGEFKVQPKVEASLLLILGDIYMEFGDYSKAERMYRHGLEIEKRLHGPTHVHVARCLDSLAIVTGEQGRLSEAEAMIREALEMDRKFHDEGHEDLLGHLHNLANVLMKQDRLPEAATLLWQELALHKKQGRIEHPDVAQALSSLGAILTKQNRVTEAEPLLVQALAMKQKLFGDRSPEAALTMNTLAAALLQADRLGEALPLFENTLALRKQVLGLAHPHTQDSMLNLALAYRRARRLTNALELTEELLQLKKEYRGLDHPETLRTATSLAQTFLEAERWTNAIALLEETYSRQKAKPGPPDRDTINTMGSLARAYTGAGRRDEARSLIETTVELSRSKLGPDDPFTLWAICDLGAAYVDAGRLEQALPQYEDAFRRYKAKWGSDYPKTLTTLDKLADVCFQAGKFATAATHWSELLELTRQKLPSDDLQLAETRRRLGICLMHEGKPADAELQLRECLPVFEARQPGRSITFSVLSDLGWALLEQKKYSAAEPLLLKAHEGLSQRQTQDPSRSRSQLLKATTERLVQIYEACGNPEAAARWREKLSPTAPP